MALAVSARGGFIVFEGADRAGKTTQCQLLVQHLKSLGLDVEFWRFPDRTTPVGSLINSYLTSQQEHNDRAVHQLFSANRSEKADELRRKVEGGTTLVVDRYAYSGAAYTAAKGCPGLDLEWCRAQDRGLPRPDAIFFLSLTPEQAQARGGYGEERYEKADFQQAVLQQFQLLMDPSWRVVDAGQSIEAVQAQLQEAAEGVVQRVQASNAPLGMLWDEPSPLHTEQPLVDIANTNTRRPR